MHRGNQFLYLIYDQFMHKVFFFNVWRVCELTYRLLLWLTLSPCPRYVVVQRPLLLVAGGAEGKHVDERRGRAATLYDDDWWYIYRIFSNLGLSTIQIFTLYDIFRHMVI